MKLGRITSLVLETVPKWTRVPLTAHVRIHLAFIDLVFLQYVLLRLPLGSRSTKVGVLDIKDRSLGLHSLLECWLTHVVRSVGVGACGTVPHTISSVVRRMDTLSSFEVSRMIFSLSVSGDTMEITTVVAIRTTPSFCVVLITEDVRVIVESTIFQKKWSASTLTRVVPEEASVWTVLFTLLVFE